MRWLRKLNPINKIKADIGKAMGEKIGEAIREYFSSFWKHLESVREEILSAFQRDHDPLGRVLKCHLILETYMDSCIEYLNKGQLSIEDTSLKFSQKIDLLENKLDGMDSYFKGIRSLNTIRNKFAHNLQYKITLCDVQSMKVYVEMYKRERMLDPIRMIEEFTIIACALLKNETNERFAGLSRTYAVLAKTLELDPKLYEDFLNKKIE